MTHTHFRDKLDPKRKNSLQNTTLLSTAAALVFGLSAAAQAGTIVLTQGDADCFGGDPADCVAGALSALPIFSAPIDNSDPGDPAGTDIIGPLGTVSFGFGLDLLGDTADSALVTIVVAGIDIFIEPSGGGDAVVGAEFTFNGTQVGTFHEPVVIGSDINQRKITTLVFSFDTALLIDGGTNTLTVAPEQDFGLAAFEAYGIDYASLTVETSSAVGPDVPLPAPLALLAGGIIALGAAGRKRRAG